MEHFFGLHSGHLTRKADQIARKHGAAHVNHTEPRGEKRGWFVCANRGEPFDQATAQAVLADIDAAGGIDALRRPRSAAAAALGRLGGRATKGLSTPRKARAARRNGAKGGRPKTLRYAVRTDAGEVGRYSSLAAARCAAKAEVADTRGATAIGAPAWIDGNDCIEAYTARDGDDHSPVAVVTHLDAMAR